MYQACICHVCPIENDHHCHQREDMYLLRNALLLIQGPYIQLEPLHLRIKTTSKEGPLSLQQYHKLHSHFIDVVFCLSHVK